MFRYGEGESNKMSDWDTNCAATIELFLERGTRGWGRGAALKEAYSGSVYLL